MTTGAKDLVGTADSLTFKVGNNPKRVMQVRVTLTPNDLYAVTFFKAGKAPQIEDGIHREMLQEVLSANTGFYMSLRASA